MNIALRSAKVIMFLEALSLFALMVSKEIDLVWFTVPVVLFLVALAIWKKTIQISAKTVDRIIFASLVGLVGAGIALSFIDFAHPLVLMGQLSPILHGLLWWQQPTWRNRAWRLGFSFIQLAVATSLSPDFYYAAMLLVFFVLACLAITLLFLESEFSRRDSQQDVLRSKLKLKPFTIFFTVSTLLTSALIFPFLPRLDVDGSRERARQAATIGYNEAVDLHSWSKFSGTNEGPTILRIFLPSADIKKNDRLLPHGLVRSAVLNGFDGENWKSDRKLLDLKYRPNQQMIEGETATITLIREPIKSKNLPVPYGTVVAHVTNKRYAAARRMKTGEWSMPMQTNWRLHYEVSVNQNHVLRNPPRPEDHYLPEEWTRAEDNRFRSLAENIFAGARGTRAKIARLKEFFKQEKFTSSLNEQSTVPKKHKAVLEEFLFERKTGHCEFFAASSALLLRSAGEAARLVVGFRIQSPLDEDIVSIRQGDAHAWVEVYDSEAGWITLDTTPMTIVPFSLFRVMRDQGDLIEAYWYKYVLSYDSDYQRLLVRQVFRNARKSITGLAGSPAFYVSLVLAAVLLPLIGYLRPVLRRPSGGMYHQPLSLKWRRFRYERKGIRDEAWLKTYNLLRFGNRKPGSKQWQQDIRRLDRQFRDIA